MYFRTYACLCKKPEGSGSDCSGARLLLELQPWKRAMLTSGTRGEGNTALLDLLGLARQESWGKERTGDPKKQLQIRAYRFFVQPWSWFCPPQVIPDPPTMCP